MPIISNKDRLMRILDEEVNKMSKKRYKNMTPNNIKKFQNRTRNYLTLIQESKRRLNNPFSKTHNVQFTNNKNWNSNFSGFTSGVPLILLSNNMRYMGHVWVNGARKGSRTTGHFQQIQKSVNMNSFLTSIVKNQYKVQLPKVKVAPILLNAAEKHLKNLGYTAMSTNFPLGKMVNHLNSQPNVWKRRRLVYTKKF